MSAENSIINDELLSDAIEDVCFFLENGGVEIPEKIKEKIAVIIGATKRNFRTSSIEIGTSGKGGVKKFYFDPLDLSEAETICQNTFIIAQTAQRMNTTEDINPRK